MTTGGTRARFFNRMISPKNDTLVIFCIIVQYLIRIPNGAVI